MSENTLMAADHIRDGQMKGRELFISGVVAGLMTVACAPLDIRASHDANKLIHWSGFWMICAIVGAMLTAYNRANKRDGLAVAAFMALFETTLITIFALLPLVVLA